MLVRNRRTEEGGSQTRRFLDILNTPLAALMVLTVAAAVISFLFFGFYLPTMTNRPTAPSPVLTTQGTDGATTIILERTGTEATE